MPDTIGGPYRSEGWEFESLCSYLGPLRQSIFFCRGLRRGGLSEFHSGYSSVGRASDCRLTQRSDGPWFDSGWPDFPRLAAGVAVQTKACGNASAQLANLTLLLRWSLTCLFAVATRAVPREWVGHLPKGWLCGPIPADCLASTPGPSLNGFGRQWTHWGLNPGPPAC